MLRRHALAWLSFVAAKKDVKKPGQNASLCAAGTNKLINFLQHKEPTTLSYYQKEYISGYYVLYNNAELSVSVCHNI